MNTITLTVNLDTTSPETLATVVSLLKGEQVAAPAVPEGPKRTAKAAAVKETEKTQTQEPPPGATAPAATPAAPASGAQAERIPIEQVRAVMAPYATGEVPGGKEMLKEALEHFGAVKLTQLPAEKYQQFLDYLDNLSTKKTAA